MSLPFFVEMKANLFESSKLGRKAFCLIRNLRKLGPTHMISKGLASVLDLLLKHPVAVASTNQTKGMEGLDERSGVEAAESDFTRRNEVVPISEIGLGRLWEDINRPLVPCASQDEPNRDTQMLHINGGCDSPGIL